MISVKSSDTDVHAAERQLATESMSIGWVLYLCFGGDSSPTSFTYICIPRKMEAEASWDEWGNK